MALLLSFSEETREVGVHRVAKLIGSMGYCRVWHVAKTTVYVSFLQS